MSDEMGRQTLVRLYLLQAEECNRVSGEVAAHWDEVPLPGDGKEADGPVSVPELEESDERTYAEALIADAQRMSGCSCEELLAAGYALRQWVQHRPVSEQAAWLRATQCPHVTLVDGLAAADFSGHRAARDWYGLAALLRRVTLDGQASRVPVINDYVIDWVQENTSYLV
jgi:hypothetical protein